LTFIGNATALLRLGRFTLLTDPNFLHRGQYAKLGGELRSRRLLEPAMDIEALPRLDTVVLSHHHGDHFDRVAARGLDHDVPIVTVAPAARKLRNQGFTNPIALRTWETHTLRDGGQRLSITALPGLHGPDPLVRVLPEVMGSLLEFDDAVPVGSSADGRDRRAFRIHVTGDTLVHQRLHEIPLRFPDIDLVLLHLGGTKVLGVLLTMDAAQGLETLRIVPAARAMPIHTDDYTVQRSGLEDFRSAVAADEPSARIQYLERGMPVPIARG
jgi:L-ascorbate metabolism protein UlaG (beta-lactamase superfamily)